MKWSKKEKRFWKTKFSYNSTKEIPVMLDHLNLRDEYFSNEELCFITTRIKRIGRFDLDNNPIDDDGIRCLEQLEFVRELRLKSINISDDCVDVLSNLNSLELLHLGGTNITCDALAKLKKLESLQKLLISPTQIDEEKIAEFKTALPACELIVNNKIIHSPDR